MHRLAFIVALLCLSGKPAIGDEVISEVLDNGDELFRLGDFIYGISKESFTSQGAALDYVSGVVVGGQRAAVAEPTTEAKQVMFKLMARCSFLWLPMVRTSNGTWLTANGGMFAEEFVDSHPWIWTVASKTKFLENPCLSMRNLHLDIVACSSHAGRIIYQFQLATEPSLVNTRLLPHWYHDGTFYADYTVFGIVPFITSAYLAERAVLFGVQGRLPRPTKASELDSLQQNAFGTRIYLGVIANRFQDGLTWLNPHVPIREAVTGLDDDVSALFEQAAQRVRTDFTGTKCDTIIVAGRRTWMTVPCVGAEAFILGAPVIQFDVQDVFDAITDRKTVALGSTRYTVLSTGRELNGTVISQDQQDLVSHMACLGATGVVVALNGAKSGDRWRWNSGPSKGLSFWRGGPPPDGHPENGLFNSFPSIQPVIEDSQCLISVNGPWSSTNQPCGKVRTLVADETLYFNGSYYVVAGQNSYLSHRRSRLLGGLRGHLAVVDTFQEWEFLKDRLIPTNIYLGASRPRDTDASNFTWEGGAECGQPVVPSPGLPMNIFSGDCLAITPAGIRSVGCGAFIAALYEFPESQNVVNSQPQFACDGCGAPCLCQNTTVDCSNLALTRVPEFPSTIRTADFSGNLISELDVKVLSELYPSLVTMDLTGNPLCESGPSTASKFLCGVEASRTTPTPQSSGDESGDSTIVGVAAAVSVLAVLSIILAVLLIRRSRKHNTVNNDSGQAGNQTEMTAVHNPMLMTDANREAVPLPQDLEQFTLSQSDVIVSPQILGSGSFGVVRKGRLRDGQKSVAVKYLNSDISRADRDLFFKEALTMSKIDHPNCVKFIGVGQSVFPFIVLEYMRGGDLRTYLREHEDSLALSRLISFSVQLANALAYLASQSFIHRDLAARNVLLDATCTTAKIADLGLARELSDADYYRKTTKQQVPVRWMPPEALEYRTYFAKSDVWSFGVLLWEIFAFGRTPYEGFTVLETVRLVLQGHRMQAPDGTPEAFGNAMLACWHHQPEMRPSFDEISSLLEAAQADEEVSEI